ncbi:MAG: nucleotidyltransferase domain-containing protein [Ignavibacteriales bacterium]|nr:MAG: nucleotidyltransferase domain-containing protein [Ignavibacteriales bacterium]
MLLREKDKQTLESIFKEITGDFEVWAYGSRVNGTAHEGSDLDLVIKRNDSQPVPYEVMDQLRENLTESNIPILVEIRDWVRIPESFRKNILDKYEVLYRSGKL